MKIGYAEFNSDSPLTLTFTTANKVAIVLDRYEIFAIMIHSGGTMDARKIVEYSGSSSSTIDISGLSATISTTGSSAHRAITLIY